jgi:predicted alpha/beta superfamily hydrolase
MKFLTFITIISLLAGCSNQVDHTSKPRIDSLVPFYYAYVMARQVDIWLPREYQSKPGQRFPVLYMHDGQNLFSHSNAALGIALDLDTTAQRLMDQRKIKPAIIVAIWSTPRRHLEYFPTPITTYLSDADRIAMANSEIHMNNDLANDYLQFIVHELKPYLDKHYRTLPDKNNTLVAGSSMGALISFYALTEYPDVFGSAACISMQGRMLLNNDTLSLAQSAQRYIEDKLPMAGSHRLYIDTGDASRDGYYEQNSLSIDKIMQAKGYVQGWDWVTKKNSGPELDEHSWQLRMDPVLEFLLGKNTNQ